MSGLSSNRRNALRYDDVSSPRLTCMRAEKSPLRHASNCARVCVCGYFLSIPRANGNTRGTYRDDWGECELGRLVTWNSEQARLPACAWNLKISHTYGLSTVFRSMRGWLALGRAATRFHVRLCARIACGPAVAFTRAHTCPRRHRAPTAAKRAWQIALISETYEMRRVHTAIVRVEDGGWSVTASLDRRKDKCQHFTLFENRRSSCVIKWHVYMPIYSAIWLN